MLPATDKTRELEQAYKTACETLKQIPGLNSGPMHMTPDSVRQTPAYRAAKLALDKAFRALREHNALRIKG